MTRMTQASAVRIAIVALLGLAVLELLWVQRPPSTGRGRFSISAPSAGCPKPAEAEAAGEANYEWELESLDGGKSSFEQHRGRVVFVNLWATWCGPCRSEMPSIQALHDELSKEGVEFVVVSEEETDVVKNFVSREGYTFPTFISKNTPRVFDSNAIPATFIVNKEGRIVHKHVGSTNWNDESCRLLIRSLL